MGDPAAGPGHQESDTSIYLSSHWDRPRRSTKCELPYLFSCFNGGECVNQRFCDCSRFNATGPRCQAVYNSGLERDSICRTWGQYHFETFDGLYYYFPGKSTYALVRQHEMEEQSFSIQVHNDRDCRSFPYSCTRSISLFFAGEEEVRLSGNVTSKGVGIPLPHMLGKLQIQRVAEYVIVRHQFAFTLAWDGTSAVYIKMSPEYIGKTHGLCGNNNAIPQDDLLTSFGKLTEDVAEFVNSWQEDLPKEAPSQNVSFPFQSPCLGQSQESMQAIYELCETLLRSPFEMCHNYVSPHPFMAACTSDLCLSAADSSAWCRALTEYARACAHAARPLHSWRAQFPLCAITCGNRDFTYNECVTCCPVTCRQQASCVESEIACVDGCYCADGLIYENEGCVQPTECPCDFHGSFYPTGSVVHDDCNNCTCVSGAWVCTDAVCPAECSVTGDSHFMTFDGRRYTFPATCHYILAKSHSSGEFTITLQNAPCGLNQDGACIQSVNLILNQDPRRQVTLTHSGDVLLSDQYKISLPYTDESFEIRKLSSIFLQVRTRIGVQVMYDCEGLRLYLRVDARWKEDTVGLCGTFNGNMQDDFLSPVGVPESTPQLFGNSWKTLSACTSEGPSPPMDPCDVHLQAAPYAAESCSILTGELFAPCSSYLSPVSYYEQCRRDTCKCGQVCLCSALAHYAHQCRRYGVSVDFRPHFPDCTVPCEDTQEYSSCSSSCGQTCQALSVPETCSGECVEGCACPAGTYLRSEAGRCVPRSECPCYFQGIQYPPGENIVTSLGNCHCRDGMMSCDSKAAASTCPPGQVFVNCSQPRATAGLSRERTCEDQLLNLTVPAHLPCLSGCACPQGLVRHGDECFVPEECPCSWKGKEYFPGDKVHSSCHTCTCQHGSFQCTFHPCASICTTYGDRHFRTFDGLPFDFVGTCKVHLVKGMSDISFSVIIENVNCFNTGIICRKFLSINVGKSFVIFDDDTGNPGPGSFLAEEQQVRVWKAGFFTLVHFPHEHVTLLWDQGTTVHIQAGPRWQGELSGLCGNFDLKTVNEMRTPENFDLTNAQEFGSSWAAGECVDGSDTRDPCGLNPLREPFAKKECGLLLGEVFEICHSVVDVTWFYSNCLTDTCGCNRGGDCECFCTSVSAYAHQCCQHGVSVDWRSPRVCPYDCEYFNRGLGKGPYQLISYSEGGVRMAARRSGGPVFPAQREHLVPGDTVSFRLTAGMYKSRTHDQSLVSIETADRPNYFLRLASNDSLALSRWEATEAFQNRSTFAVHRNTWVMGYSSFESFAKPGYFIHISGTTVSLKKYHHSEEFRLSTLFKLVDAEFPAPAPSACEWRYDSCTSPCFRTCRDPEGDDCREVPKVEGCVPTCLDHMVLDEITQRCVYLEDCIEAAGALPSPAPTGGESSRPPSGDMTSPREDEAVDAGMAWPQASTTQETSLGPGVSRTNASLTLALTATSAGPRAHSQPGPSTVPFRETHLPVITGVAARTLATEETGLAKTSGSTAPALPEKTTEQGVSEPVFWPSVSQAPATVEPGADRSPSPGAIAPSPPSPTALRVTPSAAGPSPEPTTVKMAQVTLILTGKATHFPGSFPTLPFPGVTSTSAQPSPPTSPAGPRPTKPTATSSSGAEHPGAASVATDAVSPVEGPPGTAAGSSAPAAPTSARDTGPSSLAATSRSVSPPVSASAAATRPPSVVPPSSAAVPPTRSLAASPSTPVTPPPSPADSLPPAPALTPSAPTTLPTIPAGSLPLSPAVSPSAPKTTSTSPAVSLPPPPLPSPSALTVPSPSAATPSPPPSAVSPSAAVSSSPPPAPSPSAPTSPSQPLGTPSSPPYGPSPSAAASSFASPAVPPSAAPSRPPFAATPTPAVLSAHVVSAAPAQPRAPTLTASTTGRADQTPEAVAAPTRLTKLTASTSSRTPSSEAPTGTRARDADTPLPLHHTEAEEIMSLPPPEPHEEGRVPHPATLFPSKASSPSPVTPLTKLMTPLLSQPPQSTTATSPSVKLVPALSTAPEAKASVSEFPKSPLLLPEQLPLTRAPVTETITSTASRPPGVTSSGPATPWPPAQMPLTHTGPFTGQSSPTQSEKVLAFSYPFLTSPRPVEAVGLPGPPAPTVPAPVHLIGQEAPLSSGSTSALRSDAPPLVRAPTPARSAEAEPTRASTAVPVPSKSVTERMAVPSKQAPPSTSPSGSPRDVGLGPPARPLPVEPASAEAGHPEVILDFITTPPPSSQPLPLAPQTMRVSVPGRTTPQSPESYPVPSEFWETPEMSSTPSAAYLTPGPVHPGIPGAAAGPPAPHFPAGLTGGSTPKPAGGAEAAPTCVPVIEAECVRHLCLEGQLIQVNRSQHCPFSAGPPSCGLRGPAVRARGDKCCPQWECACRCSFFPDLNVVTFDGNHVAVFKEAAYVVIQSRDEVVTVHVMHCESEALGHLSSRPLCLARMSVTHRDNEVIVDRLNRKVTVNSKFALSPVQKYGFKIKDTGNMYVIRTPLNSRIQWFHSSGLMVLEWNGTRESSTRGLCGFCDGEVGNDLMLPNGTVLEYADDPATFLDSWLVPTSLKSEGKARYRKANCSTTDCSACVQMVSNWTFRHCHAHVSPREFCELWVRDTELVQHPCMALTAYVAMCNKFDVCVEWRSPHYCPFPCPGDSAYQPCLAACATARTCRESDQEVQETDLCQGLSEGCVCPEGTLLHRPYAPLCVPEEKCACTDSSGAPRALGETWNASLSGCCVHRCVDNETVIPVEPPCPEPPRGCRRFGEVALMLPNDHSCCPRTICVCNQTLCDSLIPECKSSEKLIPSFREDSCCPNYECACDPEKCEPVGQAPRCRPDQTLIAGWLEHTCCISYICACGVCSDQIPRCQEGEVLVVDGNVTEERCCPPYHCVCESFRCPRISCGVGTALVEVWSPARCCPYQTCECRCDTIPVPQCPLGEKLQVDKKFRDGVENVCGCTTYKCVRERVCVSPGRGLLRPGQTVVERGADGTCRTSRCTHVPDPETDFYRIDTTSVDCHLKCTANQEYEPPRDVSTCCGTCRNVSCLHTFPNGTVSKSKPGTSWISNCVRYDCTSTEVGAVLVDSPVSCPPFNETDCLKTGGYVVPFLEGCCRTCKEDGKSCRKVTVRMTIRKNDCRSNTPVNIVSCDGKCPSASIYNYNINTYARFCKCCRELGLQRRSVQLYCTSNATWVTYTIQEPTDCSCQWS
ncbi:otogelin [Ornithorhynchus anatinus]|uniref:otogelin n=1 Tax=Ornithorhynchus anatinus TaxID=9258 RepID=UPI0010A86D63|nr:otogelin [Ornithorhynchus anatinus]